MKKKKPSNKRGPGGLPKGAPQVPSSLRPQTQSPSSSSYGHQMAGPNYQLNIRKQQSGPVQNSLFVQQNPHSKPWGLSQGRGAFMNKQGGVTFANDANEQSNQEDDDDSFDEQQQQARFLMERQKKFGNSDIFYQALVTGNTLYDTSKNISRQVILEEETQRNLSPIGSNSMTRTQKTFGTQRSANTQKPPQQPRKRSFKASTSNIGEYYAGPETTTNKDTTMLEANAFDKKAVIQKHLQELNDRYQLYDQRQTGESILGLVKKKSQMLFEYVKARTSSAGQESQPNEQNATAPKGRLPSLRERRQKKQREQFPNKHMYGPGDHSIKQRSAAQLLGGDDYIPSRFESNRRLTELRKHEHLDLESSMVPSHQIWQEERMNTVIQPTQQTHASNRAWSGFAMPQPPRQEAESSDSLQEDGFKPKGGKTKYREEQQDHSQRMGSINDSRLQDDSMLADPPTNFGERQRDPKSAGPATASFDEKLIDQTEALKIEDQSDLAIHFNKKLVINSVLIFFILLLSSSDFRFENEMQKQRLAALRQERLFPPYPQIYNMDDQRQANSTPSGASVTKTTSNNYVENAASVQKVDERTLDSEFIEEVAQVVHLTTAIFLLLLGAHLEYMKRGDLYIFVFLVIVSFVKTVTGAAIVTQSESLSFRHERQQSINIYVWFWLRQYSPAPLEVFFAINDSIKYIQFVYLAKWIERKHLITVIGSWYLLYGIANAVNNTVLTKGQKSQFLLRDIFFSEKEGAVQQSHPSKRNQMEFESKGLTQILSGALLFLVSFLQYKWSTFDPMDSDLIVNEQCVHLSSQHELPRVTKVMKRSHFVETIKQRLEQHYNKDEPKQLPSRKPQSAENRIQIKIQRKNYRQLQKNLQSRINEQIDEILGKNKSISFYELLQIPSIQNVIFASICMTINYLISKGMSAKLAVETCEYEPLTCEKSSRCRSTQSCTASQVRGDIYTGVLVYILNADLLGGLLLLIMGFLSASSLFQGRRTPLIFSSIVVTIIWNIIWVCASNIQELEQRNQEQGGDGNFTEYDLSLADRIMYRGDCACHFLVYQLMIIAIPIDLCKTQMMKANVRIYAMLFSLMVAIKLTIQGIVFDNYLNKIIINDFTSLRFLVIIISILALCAMVPLFVDEMGEIISNVRNKRQIKGQIAAVKEKMMQSKEKKKKAKDRVRLSARHKVAQQERTHRYRAYSDGSSNVLNPHKTPSSQGPVPPVQPYNVLRDRRESFDSYQNLMSDEEPARAAQDRLLSPQGSSSSEDLASSRTFSERTEEALARKSSKQRRRQKRPAKVTQK